MSLQIIYSVKGQPEYVLLPFPVYQALRNQIAEKLRTEPLDLVPFELKNYIENPIAYARIKAGVTQSQLAEAMNISQAYISKLESLENLSPKVLMKVHAGLKILKKS